MDARNVEVAVCDEFDLSDRKEEGRRRSERDDRGALLFDVVLSDTF